ncbi:ABC transporter substrate-binding protein [Nocardia transvalensis]|uniref:ABC transporter substrate-binding protein n=1 Tax=Nocardia transvalensis TaxID=37333 RepID=UPI00189625F2|nr:ABC transporter substrate-binding protein [Nocardia transvalensis]MBF6331245.1 ABC transporter substrate-binding protein [Nocardia transvalensis]
MATRRAVLRAGLLLPVAAACAPDPVRRGSDAVRIAVPWSGSELAAFRAVLAGIRSPAPQVPGFAHPVDVVPLGDDIDIALNARGRDAPDIVMLPDAGRVQELAGTKLRAVGDSLWATQGIPRYPPPWWDLLRYRVSDADSHYGVPFKSANKSLVWYDRRAFYDSAEEFRRADRRFDPPRGWTLAQWPEKMREFARDGRRLLALGAADGWILANVFANVLRSATPGAYEDLAQPPRNPADTTSPVRKRDWDRQGVRDALGMLGRVWGDPLAFPGGVAATLRRQYPDAVRDVFQHHHAMMVVAPDFAEPIVRRCLRATGRSDATVGVMPFPAIDHGYRTPNIGGGDVMVITTAADSRSEDLVAALAAPTAPLPWLTGYGGFVAPSNETPAPASYHGIFEDVAAQLNSWDIFDFADLIGPIGRRNGLWRILTDFLIDVGSRRRGRIDEAVDLAIAALTRSAT